MSKTETTVVAYYYPWYEEGDWSRHGYTGTPLLGNYGTDQPSVAEKHIEWAADHGIDAFMVSWYGPGSGTDNHLRSGLLKAGNIDRVRFALFYESLDKLDPEDGQRDGLIDFAEPGVLEVMREEFRYMGRRYFEHPSYLRIRGRPVVTLYVTRIYRNFSRRHLKALERAAGCDIYFVADEAFFGRQSDPSSAQNGLLPNGEPLFDAYTAYNMFVDGRVKEGESALSYMRREALPIFRRWARRTTFIPSVMPSYHDFRGHKVLSGSARDFREMLGAVLGIQDRGEGGIILAVTSFNEWWEGTTVEPAEEYGLQYLKALSEERARRGGS